LGRGRFLIDGVVEKIFGFVAPESRKMQLLRRRLDDDTARLAFDQIEDHSRQYGAQGLHHPTV
jgi:hypothetical protein